MAAVSGVEGLLAHGGTAGAIVEVALVVGLAAVLLLAFVGRRGDGEEP